MASLSQGGLCYDGQESLRKRLIRMGSLIVTVSGGYLYTVYAKRNHYDPYTEGQSSHIALLSKSIDQFMSGQNISCPPRDYFPSFLRLRLPLLVHEALSVGGSILLRANIWSTTLNFSPVCALGQDPHTQPLSRTMVSFTMMSGSP